MTKTIDRDDDSLAAAQVDIDGAKERIKKLEDTLNSPDQMGKLLSEAISNSSVLRQSLSVALLELMNDHDTRKELKAIISKIDREALIRWGKYIGGVLLWLATIVATVFGYAAIHK